MDTPAVHEPGKLRRSRRSAFAGAVAVLAAVPASTLLPIGGTAAAAATTTPATGCVLNSPTGSIKHVISLVFDNVHFTQDNPNVPSDLAQMPNLLNFMEHNGVLLSNEHTPLIAHTADDILTTLTGVYGDKHGQPVANSYGVFNSDETSSFASSFAYWTDPVATTTTDTSPTMVDPKGTIAPAPWVPFTRAGCDVGAFSTANMEVENSDPDIKAIYGANSPQWKEVLAEESKYGYADLSDANYQGIIVHCAKTTSSVCAQNPTLAAPDRLPSEPGGYKGYDALYGNVNVGRVIGGTPVPGQGVKVNDLDGQPLTSYYASLDTGKTYYGFPGFDVSAAQTLGYVADMQEHGIPITYGYIEDAHDNHATDSAAGPGQTAYVAQLKADDAAFGTFFTRLQHDGITPANTLFIISSDEGDHFAGTQHPAPAGCDGVPIPCAYAQGTIGEVDVNLTGLLKEQFPTETTAFSVHADSAPNVYVNGNPPAGAAVARQLERDMGELLAPDPWANNDTGATVPLTRYMADQVEETILHMKTGDPNRLPTFTDFANPDFYVSTGPSTCTGPTGSETGTSDPCVVINPQYAWNHGDVAPEINTNWVAFAGPGVTARGVDSTTWADETDVRPTMMALLGLHDDYVSDGRVLLEDVSHAFLPAADRSGRAYAQLVALESAYKQLNADVGVFGIATLQASTKALESSSSGDATYRSIEQALTQLGAQRDALASRISEALNDLEFGGQSIASGAARSWTNQANALMVQASEFA
ncbi:MAG: hypothetical protein WAW53_13520 [Candidatus Dormiibacterota bacterium]